MMNFDVNSSNPSVCMSQMKLWRSPQRSGSKMTIEVAVLIDENTDMMFG